MSKRMMRIWCALNLLTVTLGVIYGAIVIKEFAHGHGEGTYVAILIFVGGPALYGLWFCATQKSRARRR